MAEIDALDPVPTMVTLESGMTVQLERLKSRQFFKLLRIVTSSGAIPQLAGSGIFSMGADVDVSEFTAQFATIVLMCVPEAEEETIEFIRAMARPDGLRLGRRINKQDEEHNTKLWLDFEDQFDNPELGDLITIIEAIVKQEAADIQALGKRLASMWTLAQKTGQIPSEKPQSPSPNQPESTPASSEGSPVRSISSRRSTGGRTSKSATPRSRASASASRRSKSSASTSDGNATNG